ncbi:MAG TPA: glycosyltransferase family 2 protein [Aggregatilineales bacterium]|nr:glycosyltransferase family 2 protein [Anaerolineales bacterium]HRE46231.1 glycosyltransferase family 2 protein [Aggregatilineales bacterium]
MVNTSSTSPAFSVIIPNWNGGRYLPVCLNALRAQTYPEVEIIVADNASNDGSQALIARDFPEVRLVQLSENRGFTGACNAGLSAARGAYLALLNNDTEAAPTWIAEVVAAFERHPDAGLVASKMLLFDKRDHFHTAGDLFRTDGSAANRGVWQRDDGQFDAEGYVFSACGGSSAYRRTMLDQVGLLDDDFFFSLEDIDLAWRAQLAGWRCVYAPRAVVYHMLSATGGGVTASFYDGRNAIYVLVKDIPRAVWRKHGGRILRRQAKTAWEALRAWRGKAARARLRGMAVGILHLPRLLGKRRTVQRTRRVTIAYIESILTQD